MATCKDCKHYSEAPDYTSAEDEEIGVEKLCDYPLSPMAELFRDEFNEVRQEPSDMLDLVESETFERTDADTLPCFTPSHPTTIAVPVSLLRDLTDQMVLRAISYRAGVTMKKSALPHILAEQARLNALAAAAKSALEG
jgi:hypothetical protein